MGVKRISPLCSEVFPINITSCLDGAGASPRSLHVEESYCGVWMDAALR